MLYQPHLKEEIMATFLITEREQAGWRFLLMWLLMTNIGFLIGAILELIFMGQLNLIFAVPLAALGQAYVINRHISIYLPWWIGTTLFWLLGLFISSMVLNFMAQPNTVLLQLVYLSVTAFVAGLFAGIPQWAFMRDWLPVGIWWLLASAINAALFFLPGLIAGIILMRIITADKVPMTDRHYVLTGD